MTTPQQPVLPSAFCAASGLLHCWDLVSPSILFAHSLAEQAVLIQGFVLVPEQTPSGQKVKFRPSFHSRLAITSVCILPCWEAFISLAHYRELCDLALSQASACLEKENSVVRTCDESLLLHGALASEPRVTGEWKSHLVALEKAFPLGVWPPSCCSSHGTEGEAAEESFPMERAASSQCYLSLLQFVYLML